MTGIMPKKAKCLVFGSIAVLLLAFLIVGLTILALNALAILGALSAALLRAAGMY